MPKCRIVIETDEHRLVRVPVVERTDFGFFAAPTSFGKTLKEIEADDAIRRMALTAGVRSFGRTFLVRPGVQAGAAHA